MDLVESLKSFVRVVETGSFSAVARESGASQSAVTRQIGQLETHFGVRLLHRTTRRLSLTDDGRILLGHARQVLEDTTAMEAELGQHGQQPVGLVRLGAPLSAGLFLAPRLPELVGRYPGLLVELVVLDRIPDLIENRLDLALYPGEIADSSLVARQIGVFSRVLVAATRYLERQGTPSTPAELPQHVCIWQNNMLEQDVWEFIGPEGPIRVRVSGPLGTNNNRTALLLARHGHGIALLPEVETVDEVRTGRLIPLLEDYRSQPVPLHVVYPSRRNLAPRTRAVLDFVVREIRAGVEAAKKIRHGAEEVFWA